MPKRNQTFSNEELPYMICGEAADREAAWHYIYVHSGWREEALRKLKRKGIHLSNAQEAVQEACIVLDRKVRAGDFDKTKSLKDYFLGICEGRVYSNHRSRKHVDSEKEVEKIPISTPETPESDFLKEEEKNIIRLMLQKMDEKCSNLLKLYMLSFSMKEIRAKMDLTSDATTRKAAFDCRQKLAQLFDKNPAMKRYFDDRK